MPAAPELGAPAPETPVLGKLPPLPADVGGRGLTLPDAPAAAALLLPDPVLLVQSDWEKTDSASCWLSLTVDPESTMIPPELEHRRPVSHGHVQAAVSCATPEGEPCWTHHKRAPLGMRGQRKALAMPV